MVKFIVYALIDPRDGAVRYVGKSANGLVRPRAHGRPSQLKKCPGHKSNWIADLQRQGLCYEIRVLLTLPSAEFLSEAEVFWISEGRRRGWPLTNATEGGDGGSGRPHTAETREKLSRAHRGKVMSLEARAKMSVAAKGRTVSFETRQKLSVSRQGHLVSSATREKIASSLRGVSHPEPRRKNYFHSEETRLLMSASQRSRAPFSPETRAKMSEAMKDPARQAKMAAARVGRKRGPYKKQAKPA